MEPDPPEQARVGEGVQRGVRRCEAVHERQGGVRVRWLLRSEPEVAQVRAFCDGVRLAAPLRDEHVRASQVGGGAEELQAGVHRDQHVQGSGEQELEAPGPELGGVRGLRYGEQSGPDRGCEVRRRDEEGYLRRDELLPASAGHSADALLGERGQGRRLGAVLRSVGHGQDDAVGGPEAIPDRRR